MSDSPLPIVPAPTDIPGVAYVPPPIAAIPSIHDGIDAAVQALPEGARGGLFAIANESGVNAAIVTITKSDSGLLNDWKVEAYIGRTWKGSTNYGVNVMKTW